LATHRVRDGGAHVAPLGDVTRVAEAPHQLRPRACDAAGQAPPAVSVPVGFTTFPGEIWAAPRTWVETFYPGLAYFNKVDKGGHFAAWEEPGIFTTEVRAAFRSLR